MATSPRYSWRQVRKAIKSCLTSSSISAIQCVCQSTCNCSCTCNVQAEGAQAGGIVTRPTLLLVGEAGPEAIMPLTRIGGDLGVKVESSPVSVNVNNYGNDEVQVTQDGNDINILIQTVENAMASNLTRGTSPLGGALSQMKAQGRL